MGEGLTNAAHRKVLWVAIVLLAASGFVIIWAPPLLPGLDTPQNLVAAWIAAHPEEYAGWFEPNVPLTLLVHRAVLWMLFQIASPFDALKLSRSIELASWCLGSLALVRRGGLLGVAAPISIAAAFGWFHLMGYLNFTFAAALVPWALVWLGGRRDRREKTAWHQTLGLALTLCVITETHSFVGAGLASMLLAAAVLHRVFDRPAHPRAALSVVIAALPSLCIVAASIGSIVRGQPAAETNSARHSTLVEDVLALEHTVFGGYSPVGAPLAVLSVSVALAWLWHERSARSIRWWVGALSLSTLVLYFVVPLDGFGWVFLKPRFALFPLLVAGMLTRLPEPLGRRVSMLAVPLVGAHLAFYGARSIAAGQRVSETVASFGHEAPGLMLPVVLDGSDGNEPAGNLGALTYTYVYALLNGPGAAPLLFAENPRLHHVLLSPGVRARVPRSPSPWAYRSLALGDPENAAHRRDRLIDRAAISACRVDSVVVIGATATDRERLEQRGVVFSSEGIGHPRCAHEQLALVGDRSSPLHVKIGYAATNAWVVDGVVQPEMAGVDDVFPAGVLDVLVCAVGEQPCTRGKGALVELRQAIVAGEASRIAIQIP